MKRWDVLLAVLFSAQVAMATPWDAGYEADPDGATDLISEGDDQLRQLKSENRERLEVEHNFGAASTTDTGLHSIGSARCFVQATAPTDINSGTAARGQYNSSTGLPAGTALTTTETSSGTQDIGAGRCWIDTDGPDGVANTPDDYSMAVWNETSTPSWVYLGAVDATNGTNRFLFDPGKYNQVYNGSFEVFDGVGGGTGSTVTPGGWALSNATVTYTANPTNTEGDGVQVDVTATAGNGAIQQTLSKLKASTTYYVVGRVKATAGDSCDMATTGASTNLNTTDVTATSFASTSGFFVTDATVTAVVLNLRSIANTDVCHWDSVAVYETSSDRRGISQPGIMAVYDSDATAGTDVPVVKAAVPNLSASFTPPGPGWIVEIHASLAFSNTAGSPNDNVQCNLDNGADIAGTNQGTHIGEGGTSRVASLQLSAVQINPTPGTTVTYTAECESTSINMEYNGAPDLVNLSSNLWIVAIPPR